MAAKAKRKFATAKPRKRHNPVRRSNPRGAGIGAIVMDAVWIYAGMWAGGVVGGITAPLLGGITGSLPFGGIILGIANAYIVGWIGSRIGGHGALMAAGAFAPAIGGAIGDVLGGVGSIFGGGGGGGGIVSSGARPATPNLPATPVAPASPMPPASVAINGQAPGSADNVLQMPVARAQG